MARSKEEIKVSSIKMNPSLTSLEVLPSNNVFYFNQSHCTFVMYSCRANNTGAVDHSTSGQKVKHFGERLRYLSQIEFVNQIFLYFKVKFYKF